MIEWIADPTAWAGLATLVVLELVLGIDNLVFIAILAEKLPEHKRAKARQIGLALALLMRIVLLASIAWIVGLTKPFANLFGHPMTWRDVIFLVGGLFLLWKATHEIHARLEGQGHQAGQVKYEAKFWMVITQIVVLDAVFSIDSVITAVGMTEHLPVMILAVIIAIVGMMLTAGPLARFVNKHPTVVMLCLGFLMMIGFSLVAEAFGAEIPKGYLYAAIGFSIGIEAVNQFANAKLRKRVTSSANMRQKTSEALLKIFGEKKIENAEDMQETRAILGQMAQGEILSDVEKDMLRGVLNLSERPVHTVMTPRIDVEFINLRQSAEETMALVHEFDHSHILVVDGEMDNVLGVLRRDDFLMSCFDNEMQPIPPKLMHEPLFVLKRTPVMQLLEIFKKQPIELAIVIDEFGGVEGIVTHIDLLEAIAGEFPTTDEDDIPSITENDDGSLSVDGLASIYDIRNELDLDYEPDGRFATIAGLILHELGRFPQEGDQMEWLGWTLLVERMDGRRIELIRMTRPLIEDGIEI